MALTVPYSPGPTFSILNITYSLLKWYPESCFQYTEISIQHTSSIIRMKRLGCVAKWDVQCVEYTTHTPNTYSIGEQSALQPSSCKLKDLCLRLQTNNCWIVYHFPFNWDKQVVFLITGAPYEWGWPYGKLETCPVHSYSTSPLNECGGWDRQLYKYLVVCFWSPTQHNASW